MNTLTIDFSNFRLEVLHGFVASLDRGLENGSLDVKDNSMFVEI